MKILSQLFLAAIMMMSLTFSVNAKDGYEIKIKIDGFQEKEIFLGYYFGDKQYLKDTTEMDKDGYFVFKGDEALEGGIYLMVLPPDNSFFQVLINPDEQHIEVHTDIKDLVANMKVTGSPDNSLFYDYLHFLGAQRPKADNLKKEIDAAGEDEKKKEALTKQLQGIDGDVTRYQLELIKNHPKSLTAALIQTNMPHDIPEFEGEGKELEIKRWEWMKKHYFDRIDLTDPRMLRTPFLFQQLTHYVEKLVVQHPDTINLAIDRVLDLTKPAPETFKFYLIHFLNQYAKSKVVGYDAVYVYIAKKYYCNGLAPWTEEDQLKKICENAEKLDPLLIGKIAPNIEMETQDKKKMWLHEFESDFTILFFWDPDCGHCKKSMPEVIEFYEKFKGRGVEMFAVCTKLVTRDDDGKWTEEPVDKCWEYISEKKMGIWLNVVDPYHRSRYKSVYDIRSTPQIYLLDHKKEILSKRIGAEQLEEVMEHFLKRAEEEKNGAENKSKP